MASVRTRARSDGSTVSQVRWRDGGRSTPLRSISFDDHAAALRFSHRLDTLGAEEAVALLGIEQAATDEITLAEWLTSHIDGLTGIQDATRAKYRRIAAGLPAVLAALPLSAVTDRAVGAWIQAMAAEKLSAKTIADRHGLLAAAMKHAARKGRIAVDPCAATNLPEGLSTEPCFLSREEFALLRGAASPRWQPMMRFLVASGARFGEASALTVGDIDPRAGTVRIWRAWKYTGLAARELGVPKTPKSVRTINVPAAALEELNFKRPLDEWMFATQGGDPITPSLFRGRAMLPAIKRATAPDAEPRLLKQPRVHDLRHTCASWMIAAGVPLPVVQAHLGHESIQTTVDRYGHLDRSAFAAAADAIGAMLD